MKFPLHDAYPREHKIEVHRGGWKQEATGGDKASDDKKDRWKQIYNSPKIKCRWKIPIFHRIESTPVTRRPTTVYILSTTYLNVEKIIFQITLLFIILSYTIIFHFYLLLYFFLLISFS